MTYCRGTLTNWAIFFAEVVRRIYAILLSRVDDPSDFVQAIGDRID